MATKSKTSEMRMIVPEKLSEVIKNGPFSIKFPDSQNLEQDGEFCEVQIGRQWQRIRFHDYHQVYRIPGLYETIFYRTLRCNSPITVMNLLNDVLKERNINPETRRILDLGAGNGMAGEALQSIGARRIVGVDIIEEARMASLRDRPWVYEDYFVHDFTALSEEEIQNYKNYKFNTLVSIAALGFGDIPAFAFWQAYSLIQDSGYVAINLRDHFLKLDSSSSFARLIQKMIRDEYIEIEAYRRYRHRLDVTGQPIYYIAIIARKLRDFPRTEVSGG